MDFKIQVQIYSSKTIFKSLSFPQNVGVSCYSFHNEIVCPNQYFQNNAIHW